MEDDGIHIHPRNNNWTIRKKECDKLFLVINLQAYDSKYLCLKRNTPHQQERKKTYTHEAW